MSSLTWFSLQSPEKHHHLIFSEEGFEASEVKSLIQSCLFDKRWCCLASDPSFLASGPRLVTDSLAYPMLLFFQDWCGARGPSIRHSWQLCPFGWGESSQMGLAGCLALSWCPWLLAWMNAFVSPGKSQESLGQTEGSASHRLPYNVLLRPAWVLQQSCILVFNENFAQFFFTLNLFIFQLKDNSFTELCWFLPHINMSQSVSLLCKLEV